MMTSKEVNDFMNAGLAFIPVGNNKKPWLEGWKRFQFQRPWPEEIAEMPFLDAPSVAVIAGAVSGGVECMDFDIKNDPKGNIWERFIERAEKLGMMHIISKCTIQTTMSGGIHLIYKCEKPGDTKPLARINKKPVIEIRGSGSYFLTHPSPRYQLLQGTITDIQEITTEEKNQLYMLAQHFDESPLEVVKEYKSAPKASHETIKKIIEQVQENKIDLTASYSDWVKMGLGIAHTFGEDGRGYYHQLSALHPDYNIDECNHKFSSYLKNNIKRGKPATVRSLYAIARTYGLDVSDPVSEDHIEAFVRRQAFKYNVITDKIETADGTPIDDLILNKLWVDCRKECGKVGKSLVQAYVYNPDNLERYNPITDYLDELQFRHYEGKPLDRFLDHLELENPKWRLLIRKWIISVVASAYGRPSELILVLIGDQHNGKTWFFLKLLPNGLAEYFAVDKLDQGKDSDILMTQKLIICDDEFSGKSKKDAAHLKAMASKSSFSVRKPYDRENKDIARLAVLCGTSNMYDIINDTTGNRRILPVVLKSRDYGIADGIDRDDLWAQAVQEYFQSEGDTAYTPTNEEVQFIKNQSEDYQKTNSEREMILKYFQPCRVSAVDAKFMAATDICDFLSEKMPGVKIYPVRVGQEMTALGFQKVSKRLDGSTYARWMYILQEKDDLSSGEENNEDPPF